jgi:hypothetical protein
MLEKLETLYAQASEHLAQIADSDALTEWERKTIGRKGEVTLMLRQTGQLPPLLASVPTRSRTCSPPLLWGERN